MSQSLENSGDRYLSLSKFVLSHIRDQNLADGDGVPSTQLMRVCMNEFCPKYADVGGQERERQWIVADIKRMVRDQLLGVEKTDNIMRFRLLSNVILGQHVTPPRSAAGVEREERAESQELETSLLEEDPESESTISKRHTEAYAAMTRGAMPLIPHSSQEDSIRTPSRKRQRIMEIAASDASSSSDPISPLRYANSTPRRTAKRPANTPLSDSRRRSAPAYLCSPLKQRLLTDIHNMDNMRQLFLKEEKKDTSPAWLVLAVESLRSRYSANENFVAENGLIKCYHCKGRTFRPGGNNTVNNFESHLRSKGHRENLALAIEKTASFAIPAQPTSFWPSTDKVLGMDFNIPQDPLTIFAQKTEINLNQKRDEYLKALEAESQTKNIQVTFIGARLQKIERAVEQRLEKFETTVHESEKRVADEMDDMSTKVALTEEKCTESLQTLEERLSASESKYIEQRLHFDKRIAENEDRWTLKLDSVITQLARSDHRNIDQIETMKERLLESSKESNNQIAQLNETVKNLERVGKGQKEHFSDLTRQSEEQIMHLKARIQELEKTIQMQAESIDELELQSQVQSEEFRRQRENDVAFRKQIKEQMDAQTHNTQQHILTLVKESDQRMKVMEESMTQRLKTIEEKSSRHIKVLDEQYSKRIRSLEKKNAIYKENIHRLECMIPVVLEDAQDLRIHVETLEEKVDELHESPPTPHIPRANGKTVLITGINGYIASVLGLHLLSKWYAIRGTSRQASSTESLLKGPYKIYGDRAIMYSIPDMTVDGAFDEAVKGVHGIFHTASPINFHDLNTYEEFIIPALEGVVVTSSVTAVVNPKEGSYVFTEKDWASVSLENAEADWKAGVPTGVGILYAASKTAAEKEVWRFKEEEKPSFAITAINPGVVMGPPIVLASSPEKLNETLKPVYDIFPGTGKTFPPSIGSGSFVDVRDVAFIHAWAYEHPEQANGERYIAVAGFGPTQAVADVLREGYTGTEIGKKILKGEPGAGYKGYDKETGEVRQVVTQGIIRVDGGKAARDMGFEYIGFKKSILDTGKAFEGSL